VSRGQEVVLLRHGETEWSRAGRHTGRTDVPLTARGEEQAGALRASLGERSFALVLTSPMRRARDTARLAGLTATADDDLREWDYGDYEGLTTAQIREQRPGWYLWRDGCPGGEPLPAVATRADAVIARIRAIDGDAALVAHGHILRILAARWLGLPGADGRLLALSTATLSTLGYEHDEPAVLRWNAPLLHPGDSAAG